MSCIWIQQNLWPSADQVLLPTTGRLRPHQELERHAAPIPIGQQILTGGQSEQPFRKSLLKLLDRFRVRHARTRDRLRDGEQIARTMIDLRHEVPDIRLTMLLIVDVGGRAVPPHDGPLCIKERRGAAKMPRVSFADREQAMLHFIGDRGLPGAKPRFRRRPTIIGMDHAFPIRLADRPISLAERIGVFDAAIGARRPH